MRELARADAAAMGAETALARGQIKTMLAEAAKQAEAIKVEARADAARAKERGLDAIKAHNGREQAARDAADAAEHRTAAVRAEIAAATAERDTILKDLAELKARIGAAA